MICDHPPKDDMKCEFRPTLSQHAWFEDIAWGLHCTELASLRCGKLTLFSKGTCCSQCAAWKGLLLLGVADPQLEQDCWWSAGRGSATGHFLLSHALPQPFSLHVCMHLAPASGSFHLGRERNGCLYPHSLATQPFCSPGRAGTIQPECTSWFMNLFCLTPQQAQSWTTQDGSL